MDPATGTGAFREAYELQAAQFRAPSSAVPGQSGPGTDVAGATATAEGTASA
ncbi:ABC transporter ATP-binding protein [Streptomyces californicus]